MAFVSSMEDVDRIRVATTRPGEVESDSVVFRAAVRSLEEAGLGDVLYTPGKQPLKYNDRIDSYWSLTPRLRPWAIVQPRNTAEVSKTVAALVNTDGCQFAIRRYAELGDCRHLRHQD